MPRLPNNKHEAFAYGVAKGMTKKDAYTHAGYNDSPQAASKLSKTPLVSKRIEELRNEMMAAANAIIQSPTKENALKMNQMGLSLEWCVEQYKDIVTRAKEVGQFAPAIAAIKNIQGIIEIKNSKGEGKGGDSDEPKMKLSEITELVRELSKLRIAEESTSKIIDITPDIMEVFE